MFYLLAQRVSLYLVLNLCSDLYTSLYQNDWRTAWWILALANKEMLKEGLNGSMWLFFLEISDFLYRFLVTVCWSNRDHASILAIGSYTAEMFCKSSFANVWNILKVIVLGFIMNILGLFYNFPHIWFISIAIAFMRLISGNCSQVAEQCKIFQI